MPALRPVLLRAPRRAPRSPLPALTLLAALLPAAVALGGCQGKSDGGTVSAAAPPAQKEKIAAEAKATLPQSSPHEAARQASGAVGPGGRR